MSEYPEDIMKAAREAINSAVDDRGALGVIARAILAERERCAGVALSTCIEVGEAHLGMLVHASVTKGATQ